MKVTITPESKVIADHQITCYETDGRQRLKPSAFMDLAQEMAYLAADAMHFGYDELKAEGKAWVLSRFHFRFNERPMWRDKVRVATWHKGPSGPFYLRDFTLENGSGQRLVSATSSWIILDTTSRRMCRTSEVTDMIPDSTTGHDDAIAEPAEKLHLPAGAQAVLVKTHYAGYSDIDLLGHTNNARYILLSFDCIGYDNAALRDVRDVRINFNHETKAGDRLDLYHVADGDVHYVEGLAGGRQAFIARIDF